jgi:hypothetical protein
LHSGMLTTAPLTQINLLLDSHGKESTEVRITQKIGKQRGISYRKIEDISR